MYADILLSTLIKQTLKHSPPQGMCSTESWLAEFRTVTLGLPRQSGKTTALVALAKGRPSLLFAHSQPAAANLKRQHLVEALPPEGLELLSRSIFQFPVELVLLDEWLTWPPGKKSMLYSVLAHLLCRRQLSQNVVIVNVGT